jgi:DNA recombination-dependent growth factor C
MNNFLSSLNNRERNLVLATLLMVVTLILFFIFTNTIQSLNFSSKKLEKAKSDYEYVVLKAQQLSNSFINQSNDPAEIKSFIDNSIDLDIKNLEVDNIDNYLKISFETKNLQESFSVSDKIAFILEKDFSKVTYSKNENGSFTELFIINL